VTDLLGPGLAPLLRDLALHRTLLAFDFDGTLAPLAHDHRTARLRPATVRLLAGLARAWPCAVISGRGRADLLGRLTGTGIRRVVGSHGAEPAPAGKGPSRAVAAWARALRPLVEALPGTELELKPSSLSVHVRRAPAPAKALRRVAATAGMLPGARLVPGKKVLNLVPAGAADKGEALARLLRRGRFERALFAGDDVTDEDVFRRSFPVPVVMVRVGGRGRSAAAHRLRRQADVDRLLALLLLVRAPGT